MRTCFLCRSILLICLSALSNAALNDSLRVCGIRVAFQEDDFASTTGNGKFLLESDGIDCDTYTLDPPPHDRGYFESQLAAVHSYFDAVSYGKFGINLEGSHVYPAGVNESYTLSQPMNYYNPYNEYDIQEKRLTELFRDAVTEAYTMDQINFSSYDLVVVFHAGIGQDFSLPFLDPTPEDIPSTYVDQAMIQDHLGVSSISFNGSEIEHGILLPESQNHLLFDIAQSMFSGVSEPCEYQYGLTGTFALMIGFAVGLPPLWNIETGESGIGIFGLMDQGSNNGRGIVPSPPTSWTRMYAGWESPTYADFGTAIKLASRNENQLVHISINESEYFLIENRDNTVRDGISLDSIRYLMGENSGANEYPPYIEVLQDSTGIEKNENGVVISVPNYDIGLPASGLLIWHIDETIIYAGLNDYSVNSNLSRLGVDLEEADGAQDIGFPSIFMFNDPTAGYFGDVWFKGNSQYELANPGMEGMSPEFGPFTHPSTAANDGSSTFIRIGDISRASDTMSFTVSNSYVLDGYPDSSLHLVTVADIDGDGDNDILGGKDSLFIGLVDSTIIRTYFHNLSSNDFSMGFIIQQDHTLIDIFEFFQDSVHHYRYDYYSPSNSSSLLYHEGIDSLVFPVGDSDFSSVEWKSQSQWNTHSKRVFASPNNFGIDLNTSGITVDDFGSPILKWTTTTFHYIAGIDLDLDASADLLALDENGVLYAFNSDLILMSGFPIKFELQAPVLVRNLFNDANPEIVAKAVDSSAMYIFDSQGNIQHRIATHKNDPLIALGELNGQNSVLTQSTIYQFGPASETKGNEWSFEHGHPGRTRALDLDYTFDESHSRILTRCYSYPNPIREGLGTLRVETVGSKKVNITIYDLAGFYIRSFNADLFQTGHQFSEWVWDVTGVEPGVYFAHVVASGEQGTETRIIKVAVIH
mgnify:FL=1